MFGFRHRFLGIALSGFGALLLAQPLALGTVPGIATLPALDDPATYVALAPPALAAAGAVLLVAGVAAVRNRPVDPAGGLAAPVVAGAAGLVLARGLDPAAYVSLAPPSSSFPPATAFVVAGAVCGAAVAPVTLGALREHAPALLAGATLFLACASLSPAPGFSLAAGLVGGVAAVGLLWGIDADGWRP